MKLKKHIDDVYYQLDNKNQYISVIGWVLSDIDNKYYCKINGKEQESNIEIIERKDVIDKYSNLSHDSKCGFILRTKLPIDVEVQKFELLAKGNHNDVVLFTCNDKFLNKHISYLEDRDNFHYSIDNKTIEGKLIIIEGWALTTLNDSNISYDVVDTNGNKIDFDYKAINRIDAYKIHKCTNNNVMCGFKIKIEIEDTKKIFLIIIVNKIQKKIELNPKKIRRDNKIRKNKLKSTLDCLKPKNIAKAINHIKNNGFKSALHEFKKKINNGVSVDYEKWFENNRATKQDLQEQRKFEFNYKPKISIIVPTYKTPEKFLKEMVNSVIDQSYSDWELCIGDGSLDDRTVEETLNKYYSNEPRIKFNILNDNLGISGNTNAALKLATGDYIALLDHDDILAPEALYEIVKRINETDADVIYTDEDKISMDLKTHFQPHFKPDYNIDLLRSNNYICHFFVVRKTVVDKVGGFRSEYDGSQDYDFIFRCTHNANKVEHIAKILYYWRMHQNSVAENPQSKMYAFEAGKRAIEENLKVCGIRAEVSHTDYLGFYRVKYLVEGNPKVSIVIPNKDEKDTLKKCIESILNISTYNNYEINIIENNSNTKEIFDYYKELENNKKINIYKWNKEFNYSAINNYGVSHSNGEYIILLNNDVEIITADWIEDMLGICQRKDVGIVGAKLLYPDDTVQHAGVIIGLGGIAGHAMAGIGRYETGYFAKALIAQDVSAVTAACLMVKKSVYMEVGQLEEKLKVAFNDVDFCLKVRKHNYLIVFDPNVELYHYESKSRGQDNTIEKINRFESEIEYMKNTWTEILENGDPNYNPNFSLEPAGYLINSNC